MSITILSAYTTTEINTVDDHFRIIQNEQGDEYLVVRSDINEITIYDERLNIIEEFPISVNFGANKIIPYGIPRANNTASLSWICDNDLNDNSTRLCTISADDDNFYSKNLKTWHEDTGLIGELRILGITEDYHLISKQFGSNAYIYAKNISSNTDYQENIYPRTLSNILGTQTLILPTLDLTFPSSTAYYYGSLTPYYDGGVYYNYVLEATSSKFYPIFYADSDINTKILTYGAALPYGVNLETNSLYNSYRVGETHYVANPDHNVDYANGNLLRTMEISVDDNTYNSERYYEYQNKTGDDVEIEQGTYIEKGIYRLTHDNEGNIIFTINDIEPENFNYELTCENTKCDYGSFNILGDKLVYYNRSSDKIIIIDDAPTRDKNPSIVLFAQTYPPQYNSEYPTGIPEYEILKNSSDTLTYPYDFQEGDIDLENPPQRNSNLPLYYRFDTTENIETALNQTKFIVRTQDQTNDEVNIAYDCNFGEDKSLADYDSYNDSAAQLRERYNTTCTFFTVETPNTIPSEYISDVNSLLFNQCNESIEFPVDSYSTRYNTFISNVMIGEGRGITYNLKNRYTDTIASITIQHIRENEDVNYAYIKLNNEVVYNTTSVNTIANANIDIQLTIYPSKTVYDFDVVKGQQTKSSTLPLSYIEWIQYNKTNTTATPDYNTIGSWVILNDDLFPTTNEGVTEITFQNPYRFYEISCDYRTNENEEQQLRIYYDDDNIGFNQYKDYYVTYKPQLLEYDLPQQKTNKEIEEELDEAKTANMYNAACNAFNICSQNERLLFAVIVTVVLTFGSAIFLSKGYGNSPTMVIVPALLFMVSFIFFASYKFIPEWFTVIMVIMAAIAIVSKINLMNYFGGNRGGSDWGLERR